MPDSLILRPISPEDREAIIAMHEAGRHVVHWSPPLAPGTTYAEMFTQWLKDDPSRKVQLVAVHHGEDDKSEIVCVIQFSEIVRGVFQNAYIGWRTHPALLNRGYGTEAVRMALRHAFADDRLRLHRVQAAILPDNLASLRVAEKCGFRREGYAERYLFIRGEWRDHQIYAITAEESESASLR